MNIIRIDKNNQINGDGLRCVIWVSGCENCCEQCHNPETWNYDLGTQLDDSHMQEIYSQLNKEEISGITLTGGDPLSPKNRKATQKLCKTIKQKYPNKTIWIYTGHLFDEVKSFITDADVLIDGKYDYKLNPGVGKCLWRGSTNQRIIDIQASLKTNQICMWSNDLF